MALLESQSPNQLIDSLEKTINSTSQIKILNSQLSESMKGLDYKTIGKRAKTRLLGDGNKPTYTMNKTDSRTLAKIFLKEEEVIRQRLIYKNLIN